MGEAYDVVYPGSGRLPCEALLTVGMGKSTHRAWSDEDGQRRLVTQDRRRKVCDSDIP